VKACVLASGSAGNAIYVESNGSRVLVDAGLTGKRVEERMRSVGLEAAGLNGLVVSHEHTDHVKGVGVLARRYKIPVWMTDGTLSGSRRLLRGTERVTVFENDEPFAIGDLQFQPFQLPHDAADPVNFLVESGGASFGIATDMGVMTQLVRRRLAGADLVLMESNYDYEMLMNGPYPWALKRRISSNHGHLANERASEAVCQLAESGLRRVILGHLSQTNNAPDLALGGCRKALAQSGAGKVHVEVAHQDRPTHLYVI